MRADFFDAHERHWLDADKLLVDGRLANADHLLGMAAECGLKCLMQKFGMQLRSSDGAPEDKKDKTHIDKIWDRYGTYQSGRLGASYPLDSPNPFTDWDVAQRYAHQGQFDESRITAHRHGTEQIHTLINKARMDGLL